MPAERHRERHLGLSVITDAQPGPELRLDLDQLAREGARRMLAAALEAEVDAYLAAHQGEVDERGRRLVVRNGHAPPRILAMGDFVPALREFFGSAAGLSASTVGRLAEQWQAEHAAFAQRDLSQVDDVYCWADGIHFTLRLAEGRRCALVIVGVRVDGTKELVAVAQGTREST